MPNLQMKYFGWPKITLSSDLTEAVSIERELSNKALALFIYLSIEQREHSRETLQAVFWRDAHPDKASGSLRVALSNLNKYLAGYIIKNRQTVSFNTPAEFEIDIVDFLHSYESFDSESPDLKNTISSVEKAVQLFSGMFLEGFYAAGSPDFENWANDLQKNLAIKYQFLLQWLINGLMQIRRYSDALTYAQQGVEIDPLNEEFHQKLMLLYAKSGLRQTAIKQYQSCLKIFDTELDIRPSEHTEQLFERIQQLSKQKRYVPHHDGLFVGRSAEKEAIKERLFQAESRLLTIVGLGGIGKTTFVSNVISEIFNENFISWLEGYRFISLVNVHTEAQLLFETARVLNIALNQAEPIGQQIIAYLDQKEMLLFFDNYEHLIHETSLIELILEKTTDIQIVVTSREELLLKEECVYELLGLPYPPLNVASQENTEHEFESITLFNHVAIRTSRSFNQLQNQRAVLEFCQFVEGMPLAIELAASLSENKPIKEIIQELKANLAQIKTKFKNVDERHQTLFSCFEYTWQFLNLEEKKSFVAIVSFVAPFSEEAAEEIMQTTATTIELLRKKSFLTRLKDNKYFKVHPLLRQFVHVISGEKEVNEASARHRSYYLQLLTNEENSLFKNQDHSIKVVELNLENIKEAIVNSLKFGEATMLPSGIENLGLYFEIKSSYLEGVDFLVKLLEQLDQVHKNPNKQESADLLIEAVIYMWLGVYTYRLGDKEKAAGHSNKSVNLLDSLSSSCDRYKILNYLNLGNLWLEKADFKSALQHYQKASQIGRELAFGWGVTASENLLGIVGLLKGDVDTAAKHSKESVRLAEQLNDLWGLSFGLGSLMFISYQNKQYSETIKQARQNLEVARLCNHIIGMINAFGYLGMANSALGEFEMARSFFRQGLILSRDQSLMMISQMMFIGVADLWKRMQKPIDALELLFVLGKYESVGRPDFYQRYQTLLMELTSTLTENEITNAKNVAELKSLNDYVIDFLVD